MRKLLAVVKREYLQRLRSKMFIVITVLGPVVMSLFAIAPALILSIRAGGPVRIAVVDETGKLYQSFYQSVMENAKTPHPNKLDPTQLNKNAGDRFEQIDRQPEGNFVLEQV